MAELEYYLSKPEWHPAFGAALRLNDLMLKPKHAFKFMSDFLGKDVSENMTEQTIAAALQVERVVCTDHV